MSSDKDKDLIDETTEIVTEDAEIKKMFDEEFDMADIFVSEDLIAKTMTAIRGLSGDDTKNDEGTENVPSKVTNIAEFTKANTKTDTEIRDIVLTRIFTGGDHALRDQVDLGYSSCIIYRHRRLYLYKAGTQQFCEKRFFKHGQFYCKWWR